MISKQLWLRALNRSGSRVEPERSGLLYNPATGRAGREGCRECGFVFDGTRQVGYDSSKACPVCQCKPTARNPQLQILGNPGADPTQVASSDVAEILRELRSGERTIASLEQEYADLDRSVAGDRRLSINRGDLARAFAIKQAIGLYERGRPLGNPRKNKRTNDSSHVVAPSSVSRAVKKFHGTSTGALVKEYQTNDGQTTDINLAYLGDCPAVAWLSDARGSGEHDILVEKSHVKFHGFRVLFDEKNVDKMPTVALWVDPTLDTEDQLAVLVGGGVEKLKKYCDKNGVLGLAPVDEYVVERLADSSKADNWFVHQHRKGREPVLRWSDAVKGFVFERDRSLVGLTGRAVYEVSDWFHEGRERHQER